MLIGFQGKEFAFTHLRSREWDLLRGEYDLLRGERLGSNKNNQLHTKSQNKDKDKDKPASWASVTSNCYKASKNKEMIKIKIKVKIKIKNLGFSANCTRMRRPSSSRPSIFSIAYSASRLSTKRTNANPRHRL